MKTEKVVVTGAAGFIGAHLTTELAHAGYDVVAIDSLLSGKARERARSLVEGETVPDVFRVDIRDDSLKDIFKGARFVFHTAALPRVPYSIEHPRETHDVNVTGTLNVLLAARDAGVERVVFSSSSSVYGDQPLPLHERMQPQPQSPYGVHKQMGEQYCRIVAELYGVETVALRYFNVYGPGLDPDGAYALVIGKFLRQRANGEPMTITGDGEQTRDFTHVRDVVRANFLAARSNAIDDRGDVFNIGAGTGVSVNRVAELIGGPTTHVEPRAEPRHTRADASKARDILEWEPRVSHEEGIAELKREFRIA